MKAVFVGSPEIAADYLERLSDRIVFTLVITQKPKASGRGLKIIPTPVSKVARKLKLNLLEVDDINSVETLMALRESAAEVGIVVAFGQKINQEIRDFLKHRFVNLHFSLLPQLRGADPVAAAIKEGIERTGVTVFEIEDAIDAGRIYTSKTLDIRKNETTESLFKKLIPLGENAIIETIEKIEHGVKPSPQIGSPTFAPKTYKEDYRINWTMTQESIERLIRSGNRSKSAWSTFDEKIIKIIEARCSKRTDIGAVGEIKIDENVLVQTGSGVLELIKLIPEGKSEMFASEWARGVKSREVLFK